ncbi:glycoside hydrolase family 10 protein [Plicaturopsis crispa FD-325 SS-3]|uniref:Beta-xylanase n=1 Tax=Plicaturopsis crispa FD-325 SS-3 TaxID=944288 RepID=A0A0C9T768_PLICR|nr:glycoside hydrolase family 10 protein [Plicaturopsis crispa FD-325 SS-3]
MAALIGLTALSALIPLAAAQQGAWAQCGGIGWTGGTTCVAGYTCVESNAYYSQCIPVGCPHFYPELFMTIGGPSPTTTASGPGSTSTAELNTLATGLGWKYFGSATDNPELTDAAYVAILSDNKMFGQITPGNSMKWDATEPERGTFTFAGGDAIASLAEGNGQLLRGHNCVWYNQLPSWVSSGGFDAATLTSIIQTHCSTVVGHYKGKIYSWDVVNEPFNDDGTWRTDVFYNTLNTAYVGIALNAARSADPAAKVYINEYNIEYAGAKQTSMLNLVKSLKAAGTPLDGIGLQCHFIVGEVPTGLQASLEAFTALGVEVALTEVDIRMTLPSTPALLAQQQKDYQSVVAACKAVSGCVGVTIWDYTDKYSWVPSTFPGQGAACPWDQNLVKKPAYDGIVAALQ